MENFICSVCVDPGKHRMESILHADVSILLRSYREHLLKNSDKLNKNHAVSFLERVLYYAYTAVLLSSPFFLCLPVLYAQYAYSKARLDEDKHALHINVDNFTLLEVFRYVGMPSLILLLSGIFIFICSIDVIVHFAKPRIHRNNVFLSNSFLD